MINWLQAKIEEYQVNQRRKKYKRDVYFRIVDDTIYGEGLVIFEILKGRFAGTIYSIKDVKVLDDNGRATWSGEVLEPGAALIYGRGFNENLDEKLSKEVREILMVILEEASSNKKSIREEVLSDDEDGICVVEEPTLQRTLLQEGNALSETRVFPRNTRKNPVRRNSKSCSQVQQPANN